MAKTTRGLSEAERTERRARDRERLWHAAQELLTSDGWQRCVPFRALFHNYSLRNCLLLGAQCHERGIEVTRVAGFRTWLRLGRCVRKGAFARDIDFEVALEPISESAGGWCDPESPRRSTRSRGGWRRR